VASGSARSASEIVAAVQVATDQEKRGGGRLAVAAETWSPGWAKYARNSKTVFGLGAAWGRWALALELAGVPKARISRVLPQTWRRLVLGNGALGKPAAVAYARSRFGVVAGEDEAEALCIAAWGLVQSRMGQSGGRQQRQRKEQGR
jgi:hypothetical protein